ILSGVTGLPLPPFGVDPPRMVEILSLILLAVTLVAIYVFRVSGPLALDLCGRGDGGALSGRFRRRHSGLCQIVLPARVGADRLGAAVPDRASDRAGILRRARLSGSAPIPPEDREALKRDDRKVDQASSLSLLAMTILIRVNIIRSRLAGQAAHARAA